MTGYASRTGTKRNLDVLRRHGWRLMVSATGVWRTEGMPYALDNGAWTAYQQGRPFDGDLFRRVVARLGEHADWVVVPDIVGGGRASLEFSLDWLPELAGLRLLLAVQDDLTPQEVAPVLPQVAGIFIGGTSAWKERTAREWGVLAQTTGCYLHMGRVNSKRRIALAAQVGCDSFDGTSVSRFSATMAHLDFARRQRTFSAVML